MFTDNILAVFRRQKKFLLIMILTNVLRLVFFLLIWEIIFAITRLLLPGLSTVKPKCNRNNGYCKQICLRLAFILHKTSITEMIYGVVKLVSSMSMDSDKITGRLSNIWPMEFFFLSGCSDDTKYLSC